MGSPHDRALRPYVRARCPAFPQNKIVKARGLAVVGWLIFGALALGLCPLLWTWLTNQPTSWCYGLADGVPASRLVVMPIRTVTRQPSLWPCVAPAIIPPLIGLLLVVRRPRGWGWLTVTAGCLSYAVIAVLLAGVGC